MALPAERDADAGSEVTQGIARSREVADDKALGERGRVVLVRPLPNSSAASWLIILAVTLLGQSGSGSALVG